MWRGDNKLAFCYLRGFVASARLIRLSNSSSSSRARLFHAMGFLEQCTGKGGCLKPEDGRAGPGEFHTAGFKG